MTEDATDLLYEVKRLQSRLDVFEGLLEGVQILGPELDYRYLNRAAAAHGRLPREAYIGRRMAELFPGVEHTGMYASLQACLRDSTPRTMENRFTFPDGSQRWFELRIEPASEGVLVLSVDIDARKTAEEAAARAARLDGLVRLSAGLAHDLNNLLTVVLAAIEAAQLALPPDAPARGRLDRAVWAVHQCAELNRQLLPLGRKPEGEPAPVDPAQVLVEVGRAVADIISPDIDLAVEAEPAGAVSMHAGQLEEILLNLATNACDAMPRGGRLLMSVAPVDLADTVHGPHEPIQPGRYARITVSDTGTGMTPAIRERSFDAYFTTKDATAKGFATKGSARTRPTGGTGLGLPTTQTIVTMAGGTLVLFTEPGRGTTFHIYLPRLDAREPARRPAAPSVDTLRGTETVLVVDDDPALRLLCSRHLSDLGYVVMSADTGAEALRFADMYSGGIDVLVTDLVLSDALGTELARRFAGKRPGVPVVYMTGFTDWSRFPATVGAQRLNKPFAPSDLARAVRFAVAARAASSG
jgi:two-component system cell cycle sensor histidine kinase/response regulator CckA